MSGDVSHEHQPASLGEGAPVLDIGGDVGALVLYTTTADLGREIEVSPEDRPTHRTHTAVLTRSVGGRTVCAALYAELPAGRYRIWHDDPAHRKTVVVEGGKVAEVDWRH
jgi:hypothetical protein